MKKAFIASLAALFLTATTAGGALAVPPHQHFITTPVGTHEIGGDTCGGPMPHEPAFHNLHYNVHVGTPGTHAMDNAANPVDVSGTPCP